MRRTLAVLAAAATFTGLAASPALAAKAATIKSATLTVNGGDPALFDAGDVFVLRFSKPLGKSLYLIDEPTVRVVDAAGRNWLLEPGVDGYGVRFVLTGKRTVQVTTIDTENLLVLPLTIVDTNIYGRNGAEVSVAGSRDTLID